MAFLYFATISIFSLALFVTIIDGRNVPDGNWFSESLKDEHSLVTKAIGDNVIKVDLCLPLSENKKHDCDTETNQNTRQKKKFHELHMTMKSGLKEITNHFSRILN
ncbi:hypothetical protein LIER_28087 [Lithospermum erythrorhizon]|uniref:Uncharacterized protein n=1 Tax=Lithospermum erythrorhizon TaxID=34254 RepID=A0AAV3RFH0_LITER